MQFPFVINGEIVQVSCTRNKGGVISNININIKATKTAETSESENESESSNTIDIEFLKYDENNNPALARVNNGGAWSFVSFNNAAFLEGVTDENGVLQGAFILKKAEINGKPYLTNIEYNSAAEGTSKSQTFFYDSFGKISGIEISSGTETNIDGENEPQSYNAIFNGKGLVQWERNGDVYNFQWDEKKHLVAMDCKITNTAGSENGENGEITEAEFLYEYTFDNRGNWIERRELGMEQIAGISNAGTITVIKRKIQYKK
jgi:hypothetical protein